MKRFTVRIPVYWYGGDQATMGNPNYTEVSVDSEEEAREIKRRTDKAYTLLKLGVNINSGASWRFVEEVERAYGTDGYGHINGLASIYENRKLS